MKKSELKQLIKECIQELKDIGGASLDTNVANLKKQLKYFSNVIDYLEGKGDLNGAGKAKKEYHAIKQQLKKLGVNEMYKKKVGITGANVIPGKHTEFMQKQCEKLKLDKAKCIASGDTTGAEKAEKGLQNWKQINPDLKIDENSSSPTKLDIKRVVDIEVGGIDEHDYPDFCDATVESASYEITKDEFLTTDKSLNPIEHNGKFFRNLTEDELDQLNNDYPELSSEKAHETMQGAGDNYRDYYEDR